MRKILVTRFSALGDVAIAYHTIQAVLNQNKDIEIIFLSKPFFRKIFSNIERLQCYDADLKNKHKGIMGLRRLAKEIDSQHNIELFIDIHNVLRTKILRFFFSTKVKKFKINKGRKEKYQLTKRKNKKIKQLKHSAERYAEVFRKAGLKIDFSQYKSDYQIIKSNSLNNYLSNFAGKKIAIAPFAAHNTKQYPLEKMQKVISTLNQQEINTFILGGGKREKTIAETWDNQFEYVHSVIGKFTIQEEIALIDACEKIITMDSGNMHLAALTSTQIVSIWGATHPYLGFSPFNKKDTIYIQKNINCRPCSVYGNKKCYRDKMYCMEIEPEEITKYLI